MRVGKWALAALAAVAIPAGAQQTIAPGPFQPSDESFSKYVCPAWFRDAKFGIWAHWGPQSVPMAGDWYARNMYIQGSGQYNDHVEHFGHPSKTGYKDIIPLWKAENWEPDRLMALYKKAGARYFVSMGCHHDNFDLWNSKYHRWNAVNMGPHRDVVGDWQKAAKKLGLRFGVSEHMGASFTWFQQAHQADKDGPYAGVPYDGADPRYEDLYHWKAAPGDTGWYSTDPKWQQEWFTRVKDLIDNYHPDLLYSDGGIPFGNEVGRSIVAHLYNTNAALHGGREEAVYNCKQDGQNRWVDDLERGVMPGVRPYAWQTDTSIGDWFYNRNWRFRGADWVVHTLVDVVSKNGNLLLNVVQRPDGTLDPEAEQTLNEMAKWISINGEAIYGSRPWMVHGEGPVRARGGAFQEDFNFTARDIRFTSKGGKTLYAAMMGWPAEHHVLIRSLGLFEGVRGRVKDVRLLGFKGKLAWRQTADGLAVDLPAEKPCDYAIFLKISCNDVKAFKPELGAPAAETIKADSTGRLTLAAELAVPHGSVHTETQAGETNLGFWDSADDYVEWPKVELAAGRKYVATIRFGGPAPTSLTLQVGNQRLPVTLTPTGAFDRFTDLRIGTVEAGGNGTTAVKLSPESAASWRAVNVVRITLTPAE